MLRDELKQYLLEQGVSDVGFSLPGGGDFGDCRYAVSLAVRLSDAIVDEIGDAPTYTYFNHYRSVNAFLDQMLLKTGLFLQREGWRWIPVAASQSIPQDGRGFNGRYSHKKAACAAGMGTVGRNSLFLHREYGPRVRLGTVFTDCPLAEGAAQPKCLCGDCTLCRDACPAGAILAAEWHPGIPREELLDPEKCSRFMKEQFRHIGRGAVCGICMRVCPRGRRT